MRSECRLIESECLVTHTYQDVDVKFENISYALYASPFS